MSGLEVEAAVAGIVSTVTGVPAERLAADMDLIDTGVVDSLEALEIVGRLERAFGIRVPSDEMGNFSTIRAIADGIGKLMSNLPCARGAES